MPKRGEKPKLPSVKAREEKALADRRAQLRTTTTPIGVEYYVLAGELAAQLGLDVAAIIDELDERAGCRVMVGGQSRPDAERDAWNDVTERLSRRKAIAV